VVWEEHGQSVLQRLAITDPGKLAQIAYGLLPRDVFTSVEQRTPGNLDPDKWAILRRVIDLIKQNANGAELGPVLETIENALRADQARLIEADESGAAGRGHSQPTTPADRLGTRWCGRRDSTSDVPGGFYKCWMTNRPPEASQYPLTAPADRKEIAADLIQREKD
jgi:hypothetical protein